MSEDWAAVSQEVADGLAEAGAPGFIVSYTTSGGGGVMNPPTQTEVTTPVMVVNDKYSEREKSGASSIQVGDRLFLVSVPATLALGPETKDGRVAYTECLLRFPATGGLDYQIEDGEAISPAGVDVLYELRCRR